MIKIPDFKVMAPARWFTFISDWLFDSKIKKK